MRDWNFLVPTEGGEDFLHGKFHRSRKGYGQDSLRHACR